MNIWDFNDEADITAVMDWCSRDREELAEDFLLMHPRYRGKPAALWIEELFDLLGIRVRDCPLTPGQLGLCNPSLRIIFINSNIDFTHHRTDLTALRASILAHEFGHLRLHEDEDRSNVYIRSERNVSQFHHPRAFQREMEADLYAGCFLLPEEELRQSGTAGHIWEHIEMGLPMKSASLWKTVYAAAAEFGVTPTLMKKRLLDLELIAEVKPRKVDKGAQLRLRS